MPYNKRDIYHRSMLDLFWHNATFHKIFASKAGISLLYIFLLHFLRGILYSPEKVYISKSGKVAKLLFAN